MSGYTIYTAESAKAIKQQEKILEDLGAEIKTLQNIRQDLLSDANWKGPKKQEFESAFDSYVDLCTQLLQNGYAHLEALEGIHSEYVKNEFN